MSRTKTSSETKKAPAKKRKTPLKPAAPRQKGESVKAWNKRLKADYEALVGPWKEKDPPPPETQARSVFEAGEVKGLSELARMACHFMETFIITDDNHSRLRLYKAQVKFIKDLYATDRNGKRKVRLAVWSAARKQGKSSLAAAIHIFEMYSKFAPRGGWFFTAAGGSKDQAAIVWNRTMRMIDRSAQLRKRTMVVESAHRIIHKLNYNTLEALSTSARSAQGREAYGFTFDELAEAKNTDLLNALVMSGRSKSAGTGLIVSTNSTAPSNPLSLLIQSIREGHAAGQLLDHICHVHAPDLTKKSQGIWTDKAIKIANPGWDADPPMIDWEILEGDRIKAQNSPSERATWIARRLNASTGSAAALVDPARWKSFECKPTQRESLKEAHIGARCVLGVDLSRTTDMSAVVAYFPATGFVQSVAWLPKVGIDEKELLDKVPYTAWNQDGWLRLCEGRVVDYRDIADYIIEAMGRWEVDKVRFDPYMFPSLKNSLEARGVDTDSDSFHECWEPFRQGYVSYTPAIAEMERLIEVGGIKHLGDPVLATSMTGVQVESAANQATDARRPTKSTYQARIDCAVALIMAVLPYHDETEEVQGAPTELIDMFQKGGKIT